MRPAGLPAKPRVTNPSVAAIGNLELAVLRRLDGLLQGDYAGLLPGPGSDTGEARPYVAGDDTRHIDWAVTARTTEPHVRDTIADRELELWLVVDASQSLAFGTSRSEKRDVVWAAAGAFGLLAARGGNRVGALTTASTRSVFAARSTHAHVASILTSLRQPSETAPEDDTGLREALRRGRRVATRRGLVVVLSDFLAPTGWERELQALGQRHDVIAVEVVDPRELSLPDVGLIQVADAETGRRRYVDTHDRKMRERYAAAAAAQRSAISRSVAAAGADHLVLRTDRDWVVDLVRFVAGRRKRRLAASGGHR
jgi:uncharacterized protein (DUF58 family)